MGCLNQPDRVFIVRVHTSSTRKVNALTALEDLLADYLAVASLAKEFGPSIVSSDDIGLRACAYAASGWRVFPLKGKQPLTNDGFHSATTDLVKVFEWWGIRFPGANIGWVPDWETTLVLDLDRHKEGQDGQARFKALTGSDPRFAETMQIRSGGGGLHLFYQRPAGQITGRILTERFGVGHGVDVRTNGYLVAPGSIHPDTKRSYEGMISPMAPLPYSLARVLVEPERIVVPRSASTVTDSIADWFSETATWTAILEPHGWVAISMDADAPGGRWRHPNATAPWSAIVDAHGQLHVFSPNTPFEPSQGRNSGTGVTKFKAFAILNHAGDMTAAAIHLQEWKWSL